MTQEENTAKIQKLSLILQQTTYTKVSLVPNWKEPKKLTLEPVELVVRTGMTLSSEKMFVVMLAHVTVVTGEIFWDYLNFTNSSYGWME